MNSDASKSRLPFSPRVVDIVGFSLLILILARKALLDLDLGWDNLAYHLPFAALRTGMFDPAEYQYGLFVTALFNGFPPLQDYIRGMLWQLSSMPNSGNLLNVALFASVVLIFSYFTAVPLTLTALALAAIPVIQVQLGGGHVDNLCNLPFALALVLALLAFVERRRDYLWLYAAIVFSLAFAANVKVQFTALSWAAFAPITVFFYWRYVRAGDRGSKLAFVLLAILTVAALSWHPIKSALLYGNPLYPIQFSLFGRVFPGVLIADAAAQPPYLVGKPIIAKWLLSVAEYRAFDWRPLPYTVAQGDVPLSARSFRMGGYASLFVALSLVVLWLATAQLERRKRVLLLAGFVVMTVLIAAIPGSHDLRYYSFWMAGLVMVNLALLWRPAADHFLRLTYAVVCVATFCFVASITGFVYLWPQGYSLDGLMRDFKVREKLTVGLPGHKGVCSIADKHIILAAPYFHRDLPPYTVMAFAEIEDRCRQDDKVLDLSAP